MEKVFLVLFYISFNSSFLYSQVVFTIEGTEINDTVTGTSFGINIPRSQPTIFTFRNNSITSVNSAGYLLQAGDEIPLETNNNLDGEVITGNKFTWDGTDETSMTHALFTGFNINVIIKYNYLKNTPNGIQRKSNGMTDVSGVIAYNILINPKLGIAVKGINGIKIYNNTFYSERTPTQTYRGLIDIHANIDGGFIAMSKGTKVFNNIFYTRNKVFNIKIQESECLEGFESDYNLFWCEAGEPIFEIDGKTKTFTQWQALGYDQHSVVLNPDFIDNIDLVPRMRLDNGTNIGVEFQTGLTNDAMWGKVDPETTKQNNNWQVGARLYEATATGKKIDIYPNPARDFFNISINDPFLTYQTFKIIDLNGQLIMADNIEPGTNNIKIPNHLASGIYNIALESGDLKQYIKKLVIIK